MNTTVHGYVLGLQHDEDGGGDVLGPQALAGFGLAAQLQQQLG